MTEREREMLREIHAAFMVPPAGQERPLIAEIRTVVTAYQRGSWLARAVLWLLPTIAGLIVAWRTIVDWLK